MKQAKQLIFTAVALLILSTAMLSNSVSPRMACDGKKKGAACSQGHGCATGKCVVSPVLDPRDKQAGKTETLECSR